MDTFSIGDTVIGVHFDSENSPLIGRLFRVEAIRGVYLDVSNIEGPYRLRPGWLSARFRLYAPTILTKEEMNRINALNK